MGVETIGRLSDKMYVPPPPSNNGNAKTCTRDWRLYRNDPPKIFLAYMTFTYRGGNDR
jgi:hypothetical protein